MHAAGTAGGDDGSFVHFDEQALYAVVERQVDHVFVHAPVEVADVAAFDGLVVLALGVGAVGVDVAPHGVALEDVEVGVGHVYHVCVPEQLVFHADVARIGGEAHGYARGALRAVPEGGAHAVLKLGCEACVGTCGVVPSFVDDAQVACVDEFAAVAGGYGGDGGRGGDGGAQDCCRGKECFFHDVGGRGYCTVL